MLKHSNEFRGQFEYRSRSLCNFLERKLAKLKFKTEGFRRICFVGKSVTGSARDCYINSSKVLEVEVPFVADAYERLSIDELQEYFIRLLGLGVHKCKTQHAIPISTILDGIDEFRSNGYLNEWVFKTKVVRDSGLKCVLRCRLTMDCFTLSVDVHRGDELVLSDEAVRTLPDEIFFESKLKDVRVDHNTLVLLDRSGEVYYERSLQFLSD